MSQSVLQVPENPSVRSPLSRRMNNHSQLNTATEFHELARSPATPARYSLSFGVSPMDVHPEVTSGVLDADLAGNEYTSQGSWRFNLFAL